MDLFEICFSFNYSGNGLASQSLQIIVENDPCKEEIQFGDATITDLQKEKAIFLTITIMWFVFHFSMIAAISSSE